MNKNNKISKDILLTKMISLAADPMNSIGGCINIINLSFSLKTSKYQVKKCMKELRDEGLVELKMINNWDEDENYPPYWGWALTNKGRELEEYKIKSEDNIKLMRMCFEV